MIYFTITLTYTQLLLLKAISLGYHAPRKETTDRQFKADRQIEAKLGNEFSHFITGITALKRHGLIEHHEKPYGYSITDKGRAALTLFVEDLRQARESIEAPAGRLLKERASP